MIAAELPIAQPALRGRRRETLYLTAFAAAAVGAGTGRAVTTTYLPVLLDHIESSPGLIGLVMLVNGSGLSVPLVVGYWSDRRRMRGAGGRLPFVLGGSVVAGGGLLAVALGASSSYLALAVFGATVYVGLNAITTAHRALVSDSSCPNSVRVRRVPKRSLSLAGSMLGLVAGGLLTESPCGHRSPPPLFSCRCSPCRRWRASQSPKLRLGSPSLTRFASTSRPLRDRTCWHCSSPRSSGCSPTPRCRRSSSSTRRSGWNGGRCYRPRGLRARHRSVHRCFRPHP